MHTCTPPFTISKTYGYFYYKVLNNTYTYHSLIELEFLTNSSQSGRSRAACMHSIVERYQRHNLKEVAKAANWLNEEGIADSRSERATGSAHSEVVHKSLRLIWHVSQFLGTAEPQPRTDLWLKILK